MSLGTGQMWVCAAMLAGVGLAWQGAHALQAPPVFVPVGGEQALPSRQVHALLQDQDARLWIGTAGGLARYDGHGFRRFPARLDREGALATNSVEALALDARGRVWVATEGGHLARWRAASDDFERIELKDLVAGAPFELWSLAAQGDRLWAATHGAGLLEIDLDGQVRARHRPPGDGHLLDVLASADGQLWLVALDQSWWRFDPRSSRFDPVMAPDAEPLRIYGLGDRGGRPWASTRDGRLCSIPAGLRAHCEALPLLALPGRARMLLAGAQGDWVGGLGELLHIDPAGMPQRVAHQPGVRGGLPRAALWTALHDRDDDLWIGSAGGGLLQLPAVAARFHVWQPDPVAGSGLRDGRVRGLARDPDGRVWIGTLNAGLHRLDPERGTIVAVALPGGARTRVWSLLADRGGELWIGHHEGLLRARIGVDGELQPLREWGERDLSGTIVDLLHRTPDGAVWAASMGGGVDRIDPASGAVTRHPFGAGGPPGQEVQQIGDGPGGRLWLASDDGLAAFDSACACWRTRLAGARVDAWARVGDDRVYALVDGQLARYVVRGDALYRDADWAPRSFTELQTLGGIVAAGEALWLIGPQGLHRYWPQRDLLESFDTRDGLATTELSDRPPHVDSQGAVWIGGEEGLLRLDPVSKRPRRPAAVLRFESIGLQRTGQRVFLRSEDAVGLHADDRELEVAVRLASLARAHAQRFSFRVHGWDEAWTTPTTSPVRHFGALPAGRYVLEVRAWDGDGRAAANTVRWEFRVAPPWWFGLPAQLVYAAAAGLLSWAVFAWRRRRARALAALAESRRQAQWSEQLAAERTRWMAELSHEIRNPLNGMLGMSRLLQELELPERGRRHLGLLVDAGRQLLRLLDDMLDWSRLEARARPSTVQPLVLAAALTDALALHAQQARERGLGFRVQIAPELAVLAEGARLRQIIDNLVGNALKFSAHGDIVVHAERVAARVRIEVRDSGPGMDDAQLQRLFQPFERVGDERAAPGTGLGLAISRSLAERMGGSLRASSQPGVGSCFTLELAAAEPPGEVRDAPADDAIIALDGLRLLVVDDDAGAREWMQALLQRSGAQVRLAPEALSALILAQQQVFDAALLDWDLPGLNGLDLARTLRVQFPAMKLLAVTGRTTPADHARGHQAGFAAHLDKPVRPDELLVAIRRLCR
ncbi:MAG: response regulator [Xanthomonadales bacterium]|nr:Sensor histidine kinase RcsC [Xanthomonadales bacterium]MCC6593423.1 response regulator [Xanthomonadales bacterium]